MYYLYIKILLTNIYILVNKNLYMRQITEYNLKVNISVIIISLSIKHFISKGRPFRQRKLNVL